VTKFNHDRPYREPDPGAVRGAPEEFRPTNWVPPAEQERRRLERATAKSNQRNRALLVKEMELIKIGTKDVRRKRAKGMALTLLEKARLKQWDEVRRQLGL